MSGSPYDDICAACAGTGLVAATAGQPGDGYEACPACHPEPPSDRCPTCDTPTETFLRLQPQERTAAESAEEWADKIGAIVIPRDEPLGCDECDDRYGYDGQPCDRHQGIYEERKRIEAILRDGLRLYASSTESFGDALRWAMRAIEETT